MHLGILPFRIYISSKTYVLKDQTLYIFYKRKNNNNNNNNNKKWISCVTENFNKTFILQTAMAL